MNQYDSVLKSYADSGLRTVEDWTSLGRSIITDSKPRLDTLHRGITVPLFSRDQTHRLVRVRAPRLAPLHPPLAVSLSVTQIQPPEIPAAVPALEIPQDEVERN